MTEERAVLLHLPPSKPIHIPFTDITLTVELGTIRKTRKQVLKGLAGSFISGELTAIMGPSGAGKSSLLNILTGFQKQGMTGTITTSGAGKIENYFKDGVNTKRSCYIMQDDQLNPLFSVFEIMSMAADLKLSPAISQKSKILIIDDILETIGLMSCKYTRCGRLSGGQKKRLSIALELVDNPPIMFLDEPTTGLDSSSTVQLVSLLKCLARGGRNIICTIHQPSATIFEMFDQVYLINGGRCVYQGSSINTVKFLQSINIPCPKYHNPADFVMDVISGEFGDHTERMIEASQNTNWRAPPPVIRAQLKKRTSDDIEKVKMMGFPVTPPEILRLWVLINRCIIQLYRDWTVTHLKMIMHFLVGVVMGLIFNKCGNDGSLSVNNIGFFLCTNVYLSYTSIMPAILKFPSELHILKKEQFNNWYKLSTYYIAFLLTNIPVQMMLCTVYVSVSYYLTHQIQEWPRFAMFLIVNQFSVVISECIGLALGTTINPVNGLFTGSVLFCFMLLFGGFLALYKHMTLPLYLISFLSYMRYTMEGMVLSTYGFQRPPLDCPKNYCHYRIPSVVLEEVDMKEDHYWIDVFVLISMSVFFSFYAYVTLKRRVMHR
uniref:ATP-binding cassette sub-family G member 1-like protein n=1 Tax=Laodelphax striatellus TaxID=195883 RepID=A0A158UYT2_LAOST|nr:ATP-binding cassette sub-family G member 1-like protein [Laodelphax striatellus]